MNNLLDPQDLHNVRGILAQAGNVETTITLGDVLAAMQINELRKLHTRLEGVEKEILQVKQNQLSQEQVAEIRQEMNQLLKGK